MSKLLSQLKQQTMEGLICLCHLSRKQVVITQSLCIVLINVQAFVQKSLSSSSPGGFKDNHGTPTEILAELIDRGVMGE